MKRMKKCSKKKTIQVKEMKMKKEKKKKMMMQSMKNKNNKRRMRRKEVIIVIIMKMIRKVTMMVEFTNHQMKLSWRRKL